jgi:hypothetical protein
MTPPQPEKPSLMEQLMEKSIMLLNRDETRKRLQIYLIDPLLNHMERVFPYIVLTCVLFTLLLIVAMLTFGMLVIQTRPTLWAPVISASLPS